MRDDDDVSKEEFNTPLMILHPDMNGKTALDLAIEGDRPVCFELMLDMLEDFGNMCLSKMILNCFPYMVLSGSDLITKYYNTCTYQPETLKGEIRVPWPHDLKELIFPSHTVLIQEDRLLLEISQLYGAKYIQQTNEWLS